MMKSVTFNNLFYIEKANYTTEIFTLYRIVHKNRYKPLFHALALTALHLSSANCCTVCDCK